MYIEFTVPDDRAIAGWAFVLIRQGVAKWAQQYEIHYDEKTVKNKHRVCFREDKIYDFFALTFPQTNDFLQFRIVSDLNNKI